VAVADDAQAEHGGRRRPYQLQDGDGKVLRSFATVNEAIRAGQSMLQSDEHRSVKRVRVQRAWHGEVEWVGDRAAFDRLAKADRVRRGQAVPEERPRRRRARRAPKNDDKA
jgi:hypothetical protein